MLCAKWERIAWCNKATGILVSWNVSPGKGWISQGIDALANGLYASCALADRFNVLMGLSIRFHQAWTDPGFTEHETAPIAHFCYGRAFCIGHRCARRIRCQSLGVLREALLARFVPNLLTKSLGNRGAVKDRRAVTAEVEGQFRGWRGKVERSRRGELRNWGGKTIREHSHDKLGPPVKWCPQMQPNEAFPAHVGLLWFLKANHFVGFL